MDTEMMNGPMSTDEEATLVYVRESRNSWIPESAPQTMRSEQVPQGYKPRRRAAENEFFVIKSLANVAA